jgi:hypothetical protein
VASESVLAELQQWYRDQCDGDWEHDNGITITTLDNPGWQVEINLDATGLVGGTFDRVEVDRSDDSWICAWVEGGRWRAACGPLDLKETLHLFLAWASASS